MADEEEYVAKATFTFDFVRFKNFNNQMRHRAANLAPWFAMVENLFFEAEKAHFESTGAYGGFGGLWAIPYSPKYAAWKQKAYGHLRKERLTDSMYESLTRKTDHTIIRRAKHAVAPHAAVLAGASLEMGTDLPYAYDQQFGDPTRRLPPRPPVIQEFPEDVQRELEDSMWDYLITGDIRVVRA